MSVIDTKFGTKTWRDSSQGDVNLKSQGEDRKMTSAEKDKLGTDDIGTMLNKMSDPNYVDPAKKAKGVGNSKMDKDAFLN